LPGFTQTAIPNELTITGQPDLPNNESTHNSDYLGISGDFSATVTSTASPGAGGGLFADFYNSGGYAGVGYGTGTGGYGYVYSGYGFGLGNVGSATTSFNSSQIVLQVTRTGDSFNVQASYGGGGFSNLLTLSGPNVTGPTGFDITGYGTPLYSSSSTTTYANFVISSTPAQQLTGVAGGTASAPTVLPSRTIGSLSGSIGGSGATSDYYSFYWSGGDFEAFVGVPDADILTNPPTFEFQLSRGYVAGDVVFDTTADAQNDWSSELQGDLAAGEYTMGIIDDGPYEDPTFNIVFATPIDATLPVISGTVPDSGIGLNLMAVLLGAICLFAYHDRKFDRCQR
jgi:hypothetical protein